MDQQPLRYLRTHIKPITSLLFTFLSVGVAAPSLSQTADTISALRIQIENIKFGRVELSTDNGASFQLVGRVIRPAVSAGREHASFTPGIVLRGGADGFAFSVGPHSYLMVRPAGTHVKGSREEERCTIHTNLPRLQGIFGDLAPLFRSEVRLKPARGEDVTFPEGFAPNEDDTYLVLAKLKRPRSTPGSAADDGKWLQDRVQVLKDRYFSSAVARAQTEKRRVVSGIVNIRAKLPPNEPDPIKAVTFLVEGQLAYVNNYPPYTYAWDTREQPDGEYVVEVMASNERAERITYLRTLVVVQNGPKSAQRRKP